MSSEDSISGVLKLIFFLLIFAGGIASDIIRKNKSKNKAEEEQEEEAPPPVAKDTPRQQPSYKPPPPAPKKPAPKPTAARRTDDSEWVQTLADQKRREAAKALAKQADAFERDAHTADGTQEPPTFAAPINLSAQKAREGFVLSEILGPPVSMR